jgi:hypothetical protein
MKASTFQSQGSSLLRQPDLITPKFFLYNTIVLSIRNLSYKILIFLFANPANYLFPILHKENGVFSEARALLSVTV